MSGPLRTMRNTAIEASSLTATFLCGPWLCPLLLVLFLVCMSREIGRTLRRMYMSMACVHLEKFSGPRSYPLVGTVTKEMCFEDFYEWSAKICKRWGDPVRLWTFGRPMLFVSSFKYAQQLLSNFQFNGKLADLDMIRRQKGGGGMSTLSGEEHSMRRKLVGSGFSTKMVGGSVEGFCEEAMKLVEKLRGVGEVGMEFDVVEVVMISLFRMVAKSDFGGEVGEDEEKAKEHMTAMHTIAKNMSSRILGARIWERNDFVYFNFTKEGIATGRARDTVNKFASEAIQKRQLYRKSNPSLDHSCYLDLLLNLSDSREMSEDEVISELNNFLGGAYDTTALAVCWTLFLLALHPQDQERCFEELLNLFSEQSIGQLPPSHISLSQTKQMKYLELCLKESLRLFPPAPIFPRRTTSNVRLSDGRVVPSGVDVLIFSNLIHKDPVYFPNPDKFLPHRHANGSPTGYIPFSLGARNCIGQTYAMIQAKVVLAYLLLAYEWKLPPGIKNINDVKISYQGLLYPQNGIPLRIAARHNLNSTLID